VSRSAENPSVAPMIESRPVRVLLQGLDEARLLEIERGLLSALPATVIEGRLIADPGVLDPKLVSGRVDVLLIDRPRLLATDFDAIERLTASHAGLEVVVLTAEVSIESLREALRAGVRELLPQSGGLPEVVQAVSRISARRKSQQSHSGKVLAFMSCKGGSGATFLAANLGYALAEMTRKQVLLIDLNVQFGDAVLYLSDRRPASSVVDVVADVNRMDSALLESAVVRVLPNYWVLPAPADPGASSDLSAAAVQDLIRFARTQADYVLIDLGRKIDAVSIQALDTADQVYPVLQQTLPYIRDGKRMLDVFRSLGYSDEKVRPVVCRHQSNADISTEDLQDALGIRIFATIANEYRVASSSVNQGIPVFKMARTSTISKGLSDWVEKIDAPVVQESSWLRRILKRG
jgi:pilus assembly protein CpaE